MPVASRGILPRVTQTSDERLFSEEAFYLQEFRGRTLAIVIPDAAAAKHPEIAAVVSRLAANGTRTILLLAPTVQAARLGWPCVPVEVPRFPGRVWRTLRDHATVCVPAETDLPSTVLQVSARLGLFKVVLLARVAGLRDEANDEKRSFVHVSELATLRAATAADDPLQPLLHQVEGLIVAGVPNVNICTVEGLGDELFTYSGSGTLFTRDRYIKVRRFGIEDFDAADHLIARGASEGYLAPRTDEQVDSLLADGFGAFVGNVHLAGIGALRVAEGSDAGEVASLYTLTRFAGGGIGRNLVAFAVRRARDQALRYVYACTTFGRVGVFFEKQGFRAVEHDEVPPEKWHGYDEQRRERVRCYRFDL